MCRCLGTRQLLDEEDETQPNGKVFKKWKLGIYTWLSYVDVDEMSTNLGESLPVLRIRDVYPGSDFCPSWIPDPNCLHPGSRIRIKEFKYFNPKKTKKWFLTSKKYDPGCSSRIPDPDADFLPIPDPGFWGQKGTRSQIRIRNTGLYDSIRKRYGSSASRFQIL